MKSVLLLFTSICLSGTTSAQTLALPIDFESSTIPYNFINYGGGVSTVISNPQVSGINTSGTVVEMVKNVGQVWGGSLIEMTNPIDFTTHRIFKMKVYSPRSGARIALKVENSNNASIFFEVEDTCTVAYTWEELTFDMTAINTSNSYQKIVFTWDQGVMGDGSANFTFLFDDINVIMGPIEQIDLPITFDDALIDYTMTDFSGNTTTIEMDPTNPSNLVSRTIKDASAQSWAGTTVGTALGLANPAPFTLTETAISVRVWSPDANIPIRLKVEDHTNSAISIETETMTTVTGQWETLVFDFNNEVSGTPALNLLEAYDLLSIFFDFGTDGATNGTKTYYFDDIEMYVANSSGLNEPEIGNFDVYPNPSSENITLSITDNLLHQPIVIVDQLGRVVIESQANDLKTELWISTLESGLYYITIGKLSAVKLTKH